MPIKIRRSEPKDSIVLSELNKKCLPIYYSPMEYMAITLSLKYITLVAEENEKIIGYLLAMINLKDHNYHIMSFGVDEAHRRHGIGSMLVNNLANMRTKEINNITLYVHSENEQGIQFYKKNGFQIMETKLNYYGGSLKAKSQDAHKMKKDI